MRDARAEKSSRRTSVNNYASYRFVALTGITREAPIFAEHKIFGVLFPAERSCVTDKTRKYP
jgi:hypothetical protein